MRILVSVLLVLLLSELPAQNGDINLLRKINRPIHVGLDKSMRVVSGSVVPMMVGLPVGILAVNYIQTRSFTEKKEPYVITAALCGTVAITVGLKYAVHRPRPFVTYPDIVQKDQHVGPHSFPSGHTSSAFALATSLSLCYSKWYVIAPAYAWAIAVGYSRMRLGVHYPTDVLIGAIIGTACSFGTYYASRKLVDQ